MYVVFNLFLEQWNLLLSLIHRGSYMRAHVVLNILNELGKSDKMREFNKFNITGA